MYRCFKFVHLESLVGLEGSVSASHAGGPRSNPVQSPQLFSFKKNIKPTNSIKKILTTLVLLRIYNNTSAVKSTLTLFVAMQLSLQ